MKRGILLVASLLLVVQASVYAQAPDTLWSRTYGIAGNQDAWQLKQTQDGNYIAVGYTSHNNDIYLLKFDDNGDTLWSRELGFTSNDVGRSIDVLDEGGYIITGYGGGYLVLMKTDNNGNHLWHHYLESGYGRSVREANNGDFLVAGYITDSIGAEDIFVARTDSDGDTLWTRTFGGDSFERPWDIGEAPNGDIIILGWTQPLGGTSDVYVIKVDPDGDSLWSRTYGGGGNDEGRSLIVKDNGGFVFAGKLVDSTGASEFWIVNADSDGDTVWTRSFYSSNIAIANSICPTLDGGYVLAGIISENIESAYSTLVIKTDDNGDSLSSAVIEDTTYYQVFYGRSIVRAPNGGYILAGYTGPLSSFGHIYLSKFSDNITGIVESEAILPDRLKLSQNYPNPFNAKTSISFELREPGDITLSVFDLLGRKISELAEGHFDAGSYNLTFDASELSSGIYFYNLKSGDYRESKSMILLK